MASSDASSSSSDPRTDQLSETSRELGASLESVRAAMEAMRARLESVERQVEGALAAQTAVGARVERLVVETDTSTQFASLASQIEALRRSREEDSKALESLAVRLARLDLLEDKIGHLRSTTLSEAEELKRALRAEIATVSERVGADSASATLERQAAMDRLGELSGELERIDALERQQRESVGSANTLAADLQRAMDERIETEEAFGRAEQQMRARVDGLAQKLVETGEEVAAMLGRIEGQSETVRESRAVAAQMVEQAEVLRQEHHATAEAQRVAEGRVESTIEAMREESERAWQLFRRERANDREADASASSYRDERLDGLDASLVAALERIDATDKAIRDESAFRLEALTQLRREVTEVLISWREVMVGSVEHVGAGLPPDERPEVATERREATRRALRAQRSDSGK